MINKLLKLGNRLLEVADSWNLEQKKAFLGVLEKLTLAGAIGIFSQLYAGTVSAYDTIWFVMFFFFTVAVTCLNVWMLRSKNEDDEDNMEER